MSDLWTAPRLVQWIKEHFQQKELPPPHRLEAEHLVAHALGLKRLDLYLQHDKPCTPEELALVRELVRQRTTRKPLSQILGKVGFWTLDLCTGPGVLTPRPDTERLVEAILEFLPPRPETTRILELGTGTAAIPLALAQERKDLWMLSIDLSPEALVYAQQNRKEQQATLEKNRNQLHLVQANAFSCLSHQAKFDLVVSNPPYIDPSELASLSPEVRQFEPHLALLAPEQGLAWYAYLARQCRHLLKPDGHLAFEHGYRQKDSLLALFAQHPHLTLCKTAKDFGGQDRVMVFRHHQAP